MGMELDIVSQRGIVGTKDSGCFLPTSTPSAISASIFPTQPLRDKIEFDQCDNLLKALLINKGIT